MPYRPQPQPLQPPPAQSPPVSTPPGNPSGIFIIVPALYVYIGYARFNLLSVDGTVSITFNSFPTSLGGALEIDSMTGSGTLTLTLDPDELPGGETILMAISTYNFAGTIDVQLSGDSCGEITVAPRTEGTVTVLVAENNEATICTSAHRLSII